MGLSWVAVASMRALRSSLGPLKVCSWGSTPPPSRGPKGTVSSVHATPPAGRLALENRTSGGRRRSPGGAWASASRPRASRGRSPPRWQASGRAELLGRDMGQVDRDDVGRVTLQQPRPCPARRARRRAGRETSPSPRLNCTARNGCTGAMVRILSARETSHRDAGLGDGTRGPRPTIGHGCAPRTGDPNGGHELRRRARARVRARRRRARARAPRRAGRRPRVDGGVRPDRAPGRVLLRRRHRVGTDQGGVYPPIHRRRAPRRGGPRRRHHRDLQRVSGPRPARDAPRTSGATRPWRCARTPADASWTTGPASRSTSGPTASGPRGCWGSIPSIARSRTPTGRGASCAATPRRSSGSGAAPTTRCGRRATSTGRPIGSAACATRAVVSSGSCRIPSGRSSGTGTRRGRVCRSRCARARRRGWRCSAARSARWGGRFRARFRSRGGGG